MPRQSVQLIEKTTKIWQKILVTVPWSPLLDISGPELLLPERAGGWGVSSRHPREEGWKTDLGPAQIIELTWLSPVIQDGGQGAEYKTVGWSTGGRWCEMGCLGAGSQTLEIIFSAKPIVKIIYLPATGMLIEYHVI